MNMQMPDPRPNVQLPLDDEEEVIKSALRKYVNGVALDAKEKRLVRNAIRGAMRNPQE